MIAPNARSHKTRLPVWGAPRAYFFHVILLWNVLRIWLRRLAQNEDPCMQILQTQCFNSVCTNVLWRVSAGGSCSKMFWIWFHQQQTLLGRSCAILCNVSASRSWSRFFYPFCQDFMGIYHVGILAPCCQKPVHDFVQAHDNSSLWHMWAPPIKAVVAVCSRGMCCRCATHPALVLGLPFRMSKLDDCKLSDRANSKQKKRTANWMGTVTHIPIQPWTANHAREEWRVVNPRRERKWKNGHGNTEPRAS